MPVHVKVLSADGSDLVYEWTIPEKARLASSTGQILSDVLKAQGSPADVYLCYLRDELGRFDHNLLERLCQAPRQYALGSRLYVVVGLGSAELIERPEEDLESLRRWCNVAWEGGLRDVLEVPCSAPGLTDTDVSESALGRARDKSQVREAAIHRLRTGSRWWARLPDGAEFENTNPRADTLLEPFVSYSSVMTTNGNVLVVVKSGAPEAQRGFILHTVESCCPERVAVAVLQVPPTDRLKALCQERDIEWLRFRGYLELRYFLMRLNHGEKLSPSIHDNKTVEALHGFRDPYSMDELSLERLRQHCERAWGTESERFLDLLNLSAQLQENTHELRINGPNENRRSDRQRIRRELNRMSLEVVGYDFESLPVPAQLESSR